MSYNYDVLPLVQSPTPDTSGGMLDGLLTALAPVVPLLLVIGGFFVLLVVFANVNHRRLERSAVAARESYELQAALLEAVKEASADRNTSVDIRGFWRGLRIKLAHQKAVVDPLVESREIKVLPNPEWAGWPSRLINWWNFAFYLPPSHVMLTDRTWEQMVRDGVSGQTIVMERVEVANWQSMHAGGDIIASPQTVSGGDASVRTGRAEKEGSPQGILGDNLRELVAALREDAKNVPDVGDRAEVRALADKIEDESGLESPDEDKVEGMLQRARRYVTKFGDLMRFTGELLRAWNQLDNPGSD